MKKNVVVCMPVSDSVKAETAQRLIDLLAHRNVIGRAQVSGTLVHKARNKLVESAINGFDEATHLLFVDDDMVFTNDDLDKLLDSGKDIIGSVCVEKSPPFHPCLVPLDKDWSSLKKLWEEKKPLRVDSVGMGFTLVKVGVLKELMKKSNQVFYFERNSDFGEDYNFCQSVRDLKKTIWVHCGSKVGHLAYLPVSLDHFMYNLQNNPQVEDLKKSIFGAHQDSS